RGVTLLGGDHAAALTRTVWHWAEARQDLVFRGIEPEPLMLVRVQRFLMRAMPTTTRLLLAVGRSHQHAIGWVDASADEPRELNAMLTRGVETPWWDYMPLDAITG